MIVDSSVYHQLKMKTKRIDAFFNLTCYLHYVLLLFAKLIHSLWIKKKKCYYIVDILQKLMKMLTLAKLNSRTSSGWFSPHRASHLATLMESYSSTYRVHDAKHPGSSNHHGHHSAQTHTIINSFRLSVSTNTTQFLCAQNAYKSVS